MRRHSSLAAVGRYISEPASILPHSDTQPRRLARHAVAEIDDSRDESARSRPVREVHPSLGLRKVPVPPPTSAGETLARYSSIRLNAAASAARVTPPIAMSPSPCSAHNRSISSAQAAGMGPEAVPCTADSVVENTTFPGAASTVRPTRSTSRRAMDPGRRCPVRHRLVQPSSHQVDADLSDLVRGEAPDTPRRAAAQQMSPSARR